MEEQIVKTNGLSCSGIDIAMSNSLSGEIIRISSPELFKKQKYGEKDMSLVCVYNGPDFIVVASDSRSTITHSQGQSVRCEYKDDYQKIVIKGSLVIASTGLNQFNEDNFKQLIGDCINTDADILSEEIISKMHPSVSKANLPSAFIVAESLENAIRYKIHVVNVDPNEFTSTLYNTSPYKATVTALGELWAVKYMEKIPTPFYTNYLEADAFLKEQMSNIINMDKRCHPNTIGGEIRTVVLKVGKDPLWV